MANEALIGYPNRADSASFSGGSWDSTLTLNNVKNRLLGTVTRSVDTSVNSTKINIDLGSASYTIYAVSIHAHNLSSSAQIQITVGTTPGGSEVYDSTMGNAYGISYDNDTDPFLGGEYTAITRTLNSGGGYASRYFSINISDTGNTDGYVEIGRIGVWSALKATFNHSWGLQHGFNGRSVVDKAYDDTLLYEKRRPQMRASMSFDFLTNAEANKYYRMALQADTTSDVLYVPDVDDQERNERYGFLGTLKVVPEYARSSNNINTFEVEILERV